MIEYEIRFKLPDHLAEVFDSTRRQQYVAKRVTEFLQTMIADEIVFVAEIELNRIQPTIGRVEL